MQFAKRISLFFLVNILVVVTISIMLNVLGVRPYLEANGINYEMLAYFCLVWGMGGAFISLALSRIMAKWMMGVQVIDPSAARGAERELVDVVYRLSKAAGLPAMPEVGVYDSPQVNAFATGPTKSRALVAVSSGLLSRMNRDQIEGVLGHEVAHVANGDMVTMTLIQGIMNAFVMFIARVIGFAVSQQVEENKRHIVHMLVVFLLEIALSILATFVVAFFSRRREYRADSGGARIAGRDKMISALKALRSTVEEIPRDQDALATLKISGRTGGLLALLSTHPPLDERIQRLERNIT